MDSNSIDRIADIAEKYGVPLLKLAIAAGIIGFIVTIVIIVAVFWVVCSHIHKADREMDDIFNRWKDLK